MPRRFWRRLRRPIWRRLWRPLRRAVINWPTNYAFSSESEDEAFFDPLSLYVTNVPVDVTDSDMVAFFQSTANVLVSYSDVDEEDAPTRTLKMGFQTSEARRYALNNFKANKLKGKHVYFHRSKTSLRSYRLVGFDKDMSVEDIRQQIIHRFEPYGRIVKVYFNDSEINHGFCYLYQERNEVDMNPILQEVEAANTEFGLLEGYAIPVRIGDTVVLLELCKMKLRVIKAVLAEDEV